MKKIIEFIKTTALGGLVLIVPIAVIAVALGYLISMLVSVNNAMSKYLPYEIFGNPAVVMAAAGLLRLHLLHLALQHRHAGLEGIHIGAGGLAGGGGPSGFATVPRFCG